MVYNIKKLKALRKFNLSNLYGLTTKINMLLKQKYIIKEYKLPLNIKILKIMYNFKIRKLKYYFNKFLFFNLYNFLKVLNLRLDFVLFNLNLFLTINQVKQHISHRHIILNNKIATKSSYCVKNNDIIHMFKIPSNLIIKRLIYNYIIRNITTVIFKNKLYKNFNDETFQIMEDLILNFNFNNLNKIVCNKTFKIKINKNNQEKLINSPYLNCN